MNWTNITNPSDLLVAANTNSGGFFWIGMVFMMWIVATIILSYYGIEIALLASTFFGFIIALIFSYAGLIAFKWVLFFIGFLIFLILYIVWSSNKDNPM